MTHSRNCIKLILARVLLHWQIPSLISETQCFLAEIDFTRLTSNMTKCIGCKREFNHQGFPSHKKFCKLYKREIRVRLSNISEFASDLSTSNEGMVAGDAEDLAGSVEIMVDNVQVLFYYQKHRMKI